MHQCGPSIGRHYWLSVGRHIGRYSIDMSTDTRLLCRATLSQASGRLSVATISQHLVGMSVDTWPTSQPLPLQTTFGSISLD